MAGFQSPLVVWRFSAGEASYSFKMRYYINKPSFISNKSIFYYGKIGEILGKLSREKYHYTRK